VWISRHYEQTLGYNLTTTSTGCSVRG
jgi:hypothetical protein